MRSALSPSVLLGPWLAACLRGEVGPDDMAQRVRGEDPRHLVVAKGEVAELTQLPSLVQGTSDVRVVLPATGDPAGLRGPVTFNSAAVDSGSAVILGGMELGLVPSYDARTVVWQFMLAHLGPPEDPAETWRTLRRELTEAATALANDGVAQWQPEIPDLLLNRDHRPQPPLPPSYDAMRLEIIDRGLLALEIAALAPQHPALASLAAAARRAVAAHCSDSLTAS